MNKTGSWDDPAAINRENMTNRYWRHRNGTGGNIGFADGHVTPMSANDIPEGGNLAEDEGGSFWCTSWNGTTGKP